MVFAAQRIAQSLIGLVDKSHFFFGVCFGIPVRMVFEGKPFIGGLNHFQLSVAADLQSLIKIAYFQAVTPVELCGKNQHLPVK